MVKIVSIAVDLKRFDEVHQTPQDYTVGYIGTFHKKDNVHGILDAFATAKRKIPQLKLKLYGYTSNTEEYKSKIDELGLNAAIELSGKLSYSEIPSCLKMCDTFVLNRTKDSFASYGYPIKLGEYFAAGRPVLLSDIGGYTDSLTHLDQVYKYPADSVEALSKAIVERYTDKALFDRIGQNGRRYAEDCFDAERIEHEIAIDLLDLNR